MTNGLRWGSGSLVSLMTLDLRLVMFCHQAHAGRNHEERQRRSASFLLCRQTKSTRNLEKCDMFSPHFRRCMLVGVCLDEQIVNEVPREAHDATVDM